MADVRCSVTFKLYCYMLD